MKSRWAQNLLFLFVTHEKPGNKNPSLTPSDGTSQGRSLCRVELRCAYQRGIAALIFHFYLTHGFMLS